MEASAPPRGLIIEMVTPFKSGGGIDGKGLERLLARVSPFAQGVFLASPRAGEGISLSTELRLELLERAMASMAKHPVPIFIWVTQAAEDKTRDTIRALNQSGKNHSYGGDLFYVDTPLYYHSNRGLPDLYREICPTAEYPLFLHNDPDLIAGLATPFKRNNIRTAILKELIGFQEIEGMIFSGSLDRAHHYQKASRQRPDFRLYDGDEGRFLDHPSRSGVVSEGANLAPQAWRQIVASSLQPSTDGADYPDRLQQIWETGRTLHQMRGLYAHTPAVIIKDALADMGIIDPPVETHETVKEVRTVLRALLGRLG